MARVLTASSNAPRTLSETQQTPAHGLVVPFTPPATPGYQVSAVPVTPRTLTEVSA